MVASYSEGMVLFVLFSPLLEQVSGAGPWASLMGALHLLSEPPCTLAGCHAMLLSMAGLFHDCGSISTTTLTTSLVSSLHPSEGLLHLGCSHVPPIKATLAGCSSRFEQNGR